MSTGLNCVFEDASGVREIDNFSKRGVLMAKASKSGKTYTQFGKLVKEWRVRAELNQTELGRLWGGRSQSTVSEVEAGNLAPKPKELEDLATALNAPYGSFLDALYKDGYKPPESHECVLFDGAMVAIRRPDGQTGAPFKVDNTMMAILETLAREKV